MTRYRRIEVPLLGSALCRGLWAAGVLTLAAGILLYRGLAAWPLALCLTPVGLLSTIRIQIELTSGTLRLRMLPFRWRQIALAQIRSASVRKVRPIWEFGGWGYRVKPGVRGYLAMGTRIGLDIQTHGKRIIVSIEACDTDIVELLTAPPGDAP